MDLDRIRPVYIIRRATGPIVIDGRLDKADWAACETAGDFVFPWPSPGDKEQTRARLLWDDKNLYLSFDCDAKRVYSEVTERKGKVWEDSCTELFIAPDPERWKEYYGFEINCVGALLDYCQCAWWTRGHEWNAWNAEGMQIATSVPGPKKTESPSDDGWQVEIAIPFKNFKQQAKRCPPLPGDCWRAGLQRCGGRTNRQYSVWANIPTPDKKSFHQPEWFGTFVFSGDTVR
jgi:hypothetical protein